MLELTIPERELFNEETQEFINTKGATIRLEHSLVSISKWESKWKKPFLKQKQKFTREEMEDYIQCMTISQNVDPMLYKALTAVELEKVSAYINDEKTATTFGKLDGSHPSRQVVTSELIYYWMTAYQIPWEAQKWHLSRLLTLIEICNIKNGGNKKMSKSAILARNKSLNAQRRAAMNTKG